MPLTLSHSRVDPYVLLGGRPTQKSIKSAISTRCLDENIREWQEIARCDNTYENYRQISAGVLLMYGGRSHSGAVDLVVKRLPSVLPCFEVKEFPRLDHFGIERTAPHEVARVVADYFLR